MIKERLSGKEFFLIHFFKSKFTEKNSLVYRLVHDLK